MCYPLVHTSPLARSQERRIFADRKKLAAFGLGAKDHDASIEAAMQVREWPYLKSVIL